jgi:hypothetical protein
MTDHLVLVISKAKPLVFVIFVAFAIFVPERGRRP